MSWPEIIKLQGDVRLELRNRGATSSEPTDMRVFQGDNLVAKVEATLGLGEGADGGAYNIVVLKATNISG